MKKREFIKALGLSCASVGALGIAGLTGESITIVAGEKMGFTCRQISPYLSVYNCFDLRHGLGAEGEYEAHEKTCSYCQGCVGC